MFHLLKNKISFNDSLIPVLTQNTDVQWREYLFSSPNEMILYTLDYLFTIYCQTKKKYESEHKTSFKPTDLSEGFPWSRGCRGLLVRQVRHRALCLRSRGTETLMWRSSDCTRDSVYVKAVARLSKAHYTDCCCQLVLLCLFSGTGNWLRQPSRADEIFNSHAQLRLCPVN